MVDLLNKIKQAVDLDTDESNEATLIKVSEVAETSHLLEHELQKA
jgi:hypothetical protein